MASIVKKRKLRTGTIGFGNGSTGTDFWQLRVDEQVTPDAIVGLWMADGTLPQPQITSKTVSGKTFVVDKFTPRVVNTERYIWGVQVDWIEDGEQDGQRNSPVGPGNDPNSWAPTVTRRPVTVHEPAESLFYESGYSGAIHTKYAANTAGGNRSPFTNSAEAAFRDQLPPHQRKQSLWTIRWVRATVPAGLIDAELKLNNADVTFSHRGFSRLWKAKTAKVESVQLSQTKVGTQDLWEITVEVLHDDDGHIISALDQGMTELIQPGQPLPLGGSALVVTPLIITDANKKPVIEPVLLDGAGRRLTSGAAVYGKWRDFALFDFNAIPLLGDLVT